MNDLPDINDWLALIDKRPVHHLTASRYWADATVQSRAFCRVTANGFLRLSTQSKALPNPLSPTPKPRVFWPGACGMIMRDGAAQCAKLRLVKRSEP